MKNYPRFYKFKNYQEEIGKMALLTENLDVLEKKDARYYFFVGTNDNITMDVPRLAEKYPDYPITYYPGGRRPVKDEELLQVVLYYLYDNDLPTARKLSGKSPYIGTAIMAHNRAGREIPNVVTLHPGELPISDDGVHTTTEGQEILGKVTASAVEEIYQAKE